MLLMIDNYDSFTYNLVQYFLELGVEVQVYRNDQITLAQIEVLKPAQIVISPGPGSPKDSGISIEILKKLVGQLPILGVCLGHQAIAEVLGAKVIRAGRIMHGKVSQVQHKNSVLFQNLPSSFQVTRYHSLIVDPDSLPPELAVTAWTSDADYPEKEIMALEHRHWPLYGVQFHPESILTEHGHQLLKNFLSGKNS